MRRLPLLLATALASSIGADARALDLPAVKKAGVLRVIVAADEAKDTFDAAGGASPGFEREMLELFTRKEGLRLVVVRAPGYAQRIPMLLQGEGDVIVAIFDTPERRAQVDFTSEVMPTHDVAVNVSPAAPLASLDALKAARVAVVRGTSTARSAVQAGVPAGNLVQVDTLDAQVAALQKDAQAALMPVSEFALAAKRFPALRAGMTVGPAGKVAWAVRKEDKALGAALDEHVRLYRTGASWNRLVVKYFGDQVLAVLGRGR